MEKSKGGATGVGALSGPKNEGFEQMAVIRLTGHVKAYGTRKEGLRQPRRSPSVDPVFRKVVTQGALADSDQFSGSLFYTPGCFERPTDRFPLDPLLILVQV